MRLIIRVAAAAALVVGLAACGDSDDDGGGGGLSTAKSEAVDLAMTELSDGGLEPDRACIERVVGGLSDADAQAIVDAGSPGDAQLTADGEALAAEVFDCLDFGGLIDQLVADAEADGLSVDRGCLENFFDGINGAVMAENDGQLPDEMMSGLIDCIDLG